MHSRYVLGALLVLLFNWLYILREHKVTSSMIYFRLFDLQRKTNQEPCPNCESTTKPVPKNETNLPTVTPATSTNRNSSECFANDIEIRKDGVYFPNTPTSSHLLSQGEVNDLMHHLELRKEKTELLGFRLQEWNFLSLTPAFPPSPIEVFIILLSEENVCFSVTISVA